MCSKVTISTLLKPFSDQFLPAVYFACKVLLRDKDDNKVEPDKTITVKDSWGETEKGERYKETELAGLRQELERLTHRVERMEHHKQHHHHHDT